MCDDGRIYQVNCGGHGFPCECRIQENFMFKYGNTTTTNLCTVPPADQLKTFKMLCGWPIKTK